MQSGSQVLFPGHVLYPGHVRPAQVGVFGHVVVPSQVGFPWQVDMSGQVNEPGHVCVPSQVAYPGEVKLFGQVGPFSQVAVPKHVSNPGQVCILGQVIVPAQVGYPGIVGSMFGESAPAANGCCGSACTLASRTARSCGEPPP